MCARLSRYRSAEHWLGALGGSGHDATRGGSAAGILAELLVTDLYALIVEPDPCSAFDAKRNGRRVEIKSTAGGRIQGVKRSSFDELFLAKLAWNADGPTVTHIFWMPNPPRKLGRNPGVGRFEDLPNRLLRPIRLVPPPQHRRDGLPCYSSFRPLAVPLGSAGVWMR